MARQALQADSAPSLTSFAHPDALEENTAQAGSTSLLARLWSTFTPLAAHAPSASNAASAANISHASSSSTASTAAEEPALTPPHPITPSSSFSHYPGLAVPSPKRTASGSPNAAPAAANTTDTLSAFLADTRHIDGELDKQTADESATEGLASDGRDFPSQPHLQNAILRSDAHHQNERPTFAVSDSINTAKIKSASEDTESLGNSVSSSPTEGRRRSTTFQGIAAFGDSHSRLRVISNRLRNREVEDRSFWIRCVVFIEVPYLFIGSTVQDWPGCG